MLEEFVQIRSALRNSEIRQTEIKGNLLIDDENKAHLQMLAAENLAENFALVGNRHIEIRNLSIGSNAIISLFSNQLSGEYYFETTDDLVRHFKSDRPKHKFYIHALKFFSDSSDELPKEISQYYAIIELVELLKQIADFTKNDEIIFFVKKPLIIKVGYPASILVNNLDITTLKSHVLTAADKEERIQILKNVIAEELFQVQDIEKRFSYLLEHFSSIIENYQKSHGLYLQNFSFQKVKSEIDKELIEYNKKIQSVINDAQTKFVTIPAAFLIVISQFDLSGEKAFFNICIVLSTFVFSVVLELLLQNQINALVFIKDDIERFKSSIDDRKVDVIGANNFTEAFTKISRVYQKQQKHLTILRVIVWLTPLVGLSLLLFSLTGNFIIKILKVFFKLIL